MSKQKQLQKLAKEEALASHSIALRQESKMMNKAVLKFLKKPSPKTLQGIEFSYKFMQQSMRVIGNRISAEKRKAKK